MNMKASLELFLAAIMFGMGFHIGWGLIEFILWIAINSLGQHPPVIGR